MHLVKFTKHWQSYNEGEVASFSAHVAAGLVKLGVCTEHSLDTEKTKAEIKKPKTTTPEITKK